MLAFARALNMVAATPFLEAIWCPTAASTQHSSIFSTLLMRPALIASPNLNIYTQLCSTQGQPSKSIPDIAGTCLRSPSLRRKGERKRGERILHFTDLLSGATIAVPLLYASMTAQFLSKNRALERCAGGEKKGSEDVHKPFAKSGDGLLAICLVDSKAD